MDTVLRVWSVSTMMLWTVTFLLFCTSGALAAATGPGSWAPIADLPGARYGPGAAALNGKIYALGGYNGTYLKSCVVFDPLTNAWGAIADMPDARVNLGAAALNEIGRASCRERV